jgi:hypothetical protein
MLALPSAASLRISSKDAIDCKPQITSVSTFAAEQTQVVTIDGSCFGTGNTVSGTNSGYLSILDDVAPPWEGCYVGGATNDGVSCNISSWTDTSITFAGFTGSYGELNWVVGPGDPLLIDVWNAQTDAGPAACEVTVGATGPSTCRDYVSLGDSVPYGHGLVNPYPTPQIGLPSSDVSDGPSSQAYPALVASDLGLTMNVRTTDCTLTGDDLTVSGAKASAIDASNSPGNTQCPTSWSNSLSVQDDEFDGINWSWDPQTLVTIQAGADDINFAGCLEWEVTKDGFHLPLGTKCVKKGKVTSTVASALVNVRSALAGVIEDLPPSYAQQVAVLDYYQIVPPPSQFAKSSIFPQKGQVDPVCWGLSHNEKGARQDAEVIQAALNHAIGGAVTDAKSKGVINVKLIDLTHLEDGHGICTGSPALFSGELMKKSTFFSDIASLNAQDLKDHIWRTGHPNVYGQQDIARAVESALTP